MECEEEVAFLVLLHKKLKKKKRKHKFWINPLLNSRQERGVFYTAFNDLRNDESKFFDYFRIVSRLLRRTTPAYQKLYFGNKKFCIKVMINYVEVNILRMNSRPLGMLSVRLNTLVETTS
jgi:hypothetical protein